MTARRLSLQRINKKGWHALPAILVLFVITAAYTAHPVFSHERDFDRTRFGYNSVPIWTPLTEFERGVLDNISIARLSDADTLLALYLLASGDVRTESEFRIYQQAITDFFEQMPARWLSADVRSRGAQLLSAMHSHFFLNSADPDNSGYALNQSTLSGIFHTQTYNCISSALLYSVLAHHGGLQTSGAIMPSHAFVQITLDTGETIEVETTSPLGFDVIRDERFFADEAITWFSERQLVISNYDDYQNRRFVSAIGLGLENLWSQHTTVENMAYQDRMRLAEIKGYLQPDDFKAQHNRLIYYFREADYFRQQNDEQTLLRLYQHIEPFLQSMPALAQSEAAMADTEFQTVHHLVQATRAQALVASGEHDQGVKLARSILTTLDDDLRNADIIRSDAFSALAAFSDRLVTQNDFQSARAVWTGLEEDCNNAAVCINAIDRIYAEWGSNLWSRQDWFAVASIYHDYQSLGLNSPNASSFADNLESAYLNMANQAWYDEDRDSAVVYLEACHQRLESPARCSARLQEFRSAL